MPQLAMRFQRTIDDAFAFAESAMKLGCRVIGVVPEWYARENATMYWVWLEVPDGLDLDAVDEAASRDDGEDG